MMIIRSDRLRTVIKLLLIGLALGALWVLHTRLNVFPPDDFVEYWSAGRLTITGGNPYDVVQMLNLEKSAGWTREEALMMLNPPWALAIAMVIGIFNYTLSRYLWFIVGTAAIGICSGILWRLYKGEEKCQWVAFAVLFSFGPTLHALKSGQISLLILVGITGFLYFYQKGSDFWAGILASLVLIKPQLLYLVIIAIVVWSVVSKRYRILAGIAAGLFIALGAVLLVNPHALAQYIFMISNYPFGDWVTTTIGANLRVLLGPGKFYIEFVPSIIGAAWFLVFWYRHHKTFGWTNDLPLLILVSASTTAYAWTLDYLVCIIAIVQIAILFDLRHWTWSKVPIMLVYLLIDLVIIFGRFSQNWYWWVPISLLIWYLITRAYLSRYGTVEKASIPALS